MLPLAVTAILIPVGLSTVGVFEVSNAFTSFGSPILFLVFGGYALAAAVRENRIDHWLAHVILVRAGTGTKRVLLSLMATSAVLSMLISNTATTALLLPVTVGILSRQENDPNLARLLMLCIAYGASSGGSATIVGSPPNATAVGLLEIYFLQWLGFWLNFAAFAVISLIFFSRIV